MTEKELSFVWGAPLSGQRRWMLRSAEQAPEGTRQSLCFADSDQSFESLLKQLEKVMKEQGEGLIQVEWPGAHLYNDIELEAWLSKRNDWRPTFTSVLLEESGFLNRHYCELYEELARGTLSSVVVGRSKLRQGEPLVWLGQNIEFGKRLKVFEDDFWPEPQFELSLEGAEMLVGYEDEYKELNIPLVPEISDYLLEKVFEELANNDFGKFWGMELLRSTPNDDSGLDINLYTLTPQSFYVTRSSLAATAKVYGVSREVSFLQIAGVGLKTTEIREYLAANELLQEA